MRKAARVTQPGSGGLSELQFVSKFGLPQNKPWKICLQRGQPPQNERRPSTTPKKVPSLSNARAYRGVATHLWGARRLGSWVLAPLEQSLCKLPHVFFSLEGRTDGCACVLQVLFLGRCAEKTKQSHLLRVPLDRLPVGSGRERLVSKVQPFCSDMVHFEHRSQALARTWYRQTHDFEGQALGEVSQASAQLHWHGFCHSRPRGVS